MSTNSDPIHSQTSATDQKFTFTQGDKLGITVDQNRASFGVTRVESTSYNIKCDDRGSILIVDTDAAGGDVTLTVQNDYPDPNGRRKRFGVTVVRTGANDVQITAEGSKTDEDEPTVEIVGEPASDPFWLTNGGYDEADLDALGVNPSSGNKEVLVSGEIQNSQPA